MNTNSEQTKKIKLASKTEPALSSGTWQLKVTQELSGNTALNNAHIRSEEFTFSCEADPYALDSSQVYSVYPPDGCFGKFETTLPSIVLKRRTLPWERIIPECPAAPWLALLLFSENEPVTLQTVKREDKTDINDMQNDACLELEIPPKLFRDVCPSMEDLKLSVHSRFAGRDDKVTESVPLDEWMSVITAGRLPCSSTDEHALKNTVYLVSMEHAGTMIADRNQISQNQSVHLPVLAHWSFYSRSEEYDFHVLFEGLSADALRILPQEDISEQNKCLLERGYVPMNHYLRDGGKTVSWYHGPLRPWNIEVSSEHYRWFSDSALIYDPQLEMFDVSISAAFQLGRMLALQNGAFTSALVQFREQRKRNAASRQNQNVLLRALQKTNSTLEQSKINTQKDNENHQPDLEESLRSFAAQVLLNENHQDTVADNDMTRRVGSLASSLSSANNIVDFPFTGNLDEEIPAEIVQPLTEWSLLYGIPYHYLVPHKSILPPESIRFFHLDHNWLTAMLDGATSPGRFFDVDFEFDSEIINKIIQSVYTNSVKIRPYLQGKQGAELDSLIKERSSVMLAQLESAKKSLTPAQSNTLSAASFLCTGFLLRSDLVKGWRGLEFRAYADRDENTNPLPALRIEVIGNNILLGIYIGKIARLEIMQPPEGMYMGFEKKPGGGYRKMLRNPQNGALYDDKYADVVMRNSIGVMDWKATADNIGKALPQATSVTSSYMALEMIQNPATGIVRLL
ncbi:MAG: hypothetical protein K2J99_02185 [Lachnospiraceae bacterium]|nr:hypothetical protein [Lachnospiraceae bacterium]